MGLFNDKDQKKPKAKQEEGASMKDLYADNAEKTPTKKEKSANKNSQAFRVLVKPLITEKGSMMNVQNKYLFEVSMDANKIEVARAVKDVYGIAPEKVNIVKIEGKSKRYGRTVGKRKDWKKAIVTLPEGKSINIYEGV